MYTSFYVTLQREILASFYIDRKSSPLSLYHHQHSISSSVRLLNVHSHVRSSLIDCTFLLLALRGDISNPRLQASLDTGPTQRSRCQISSGVPALFFSLRFHEQQTLARTIVLDTRLCPLAVIS